MTTSKKLKKLNKKMADMTDFAFKVDGYLPIRRSSEYHNIVYKCLSGEKCTNIAKWLKEKEPDIFEHMPHNTLVKMLNRFRKKLIERGRLQDLPINVMGVIKERIINKAINILEQFEELVALQKTRVERAFKFEEKLPMPQESTRKEILTLLKILKVFAKIRNAVGLGDIKQELKDREDEKIEKMKKSILHRAVIEAGENEGLNPDAAYKRFIQLLRDKEEKERKQNANANQNND